MEQQYAQQQAPPAQYPPPVAAPAPAPSGPAVPNVLIASPTWVFVVRIFQIIVSIVIVGLCGWLMHGAYADAQGIAVASAVLTWIIVAYIVLAEKIPGLNSLYHIAAVLSLDALLVVLWLASMGANAHHRSRFRYVAYGLECYDDGSAFDSTVCYRRKRSLDRDYVASKTGLVVMIIISLLCALEFILFAVVFGRTLRTYLAQRKSAAPLAAVAAAGDTEKQAVPLQPQPQGYNQYQPAPVYQPQPAAPVQQPIQPQYTGGTMPSPQPQTAYPAQAALHPQYSGQYGAATPPPGQPLHEAPGTQAMNPQYTGSAAYSPSTQTTGPPYPQELPGQYDQKHGHISPPGSPPPPQQGYGYPPQ